MHSLPAPGSRYLVECESAHGGPVSDRDRHREAGTKALRRKYNRMVATANAIPVLLLAHLSSSITVSNMLMASLLHLGQEPGTFRVGCDSLEASPFGSFAARPAVALYSTQMHGVLTALASTNRTNMFALKPRSLDWLIGRLSPYCKPVDALMLQLLIHCTGPSRLLSPGRRMLLYAVDLPRVSFRASRLQDAHD